MGVKKPGAPDYFWFQKLRVLLEEAGEYSPQFQFWASLIGGSDSQELVDTNQFCQMGPYSENAWTVENLIGDGTAETLDNWARAQMYKRFCSDE